mgnify:CR=1 FL=1
MGALCILTGNGRRIDVLRLLMTAGIIIPYIIGDAVEPGGERGCTPETGQMGICLDKGILSQVVTQLRIPQRLPQEEPTNG